MHIADYLNKAKLIQRRLSFINRKLSWIGITLTIKSGSRAKYRKHRLSLDSFEKPFTFYKANNVVESFWSWSLTHYSSQSSSHTGIHQLVSLNNGDLWNVSWHWSWSSNLCCIVPQSYHTILCHFGSDMSLLLYWKSAISNDWHFLRCFLSTLSLQHLVYHLCCSIHLYCTWKLGPF